MAGKPRTNWDDRFYVKAYQLARAGMIDAYIAQALDVDKRLFRKWVESKPALADALHQARNAGAGTREFMRMVSRRIPEDIRPLWEELSDEDDARRESAYRLVRYGDKRKSQHVYIHAYIAMNFHQARTLDVTGLCIQTVEAWKRTDRGFRKLLDFVSECRKDFVENALMEKIHQGDTASIIFANRTLNKDRGYSQHITIDVKGEVEHKNTIDLRALPPEKLRELLEYARAQKVTRIEGRSGVQDAEFSVKEG